jgi:hypothetical protein
MNSIPRQARDGLTRAWIEILQERHPTVAWIVTDPTVEHDAYQQDSHATTPRGEPKHRANRHSGSRPITLHPTT